MEKFSELVREKEELAEALLDMYGQYCDRGHPFMSAGEFASRVLEEQGYAKFDEAGRMITTDSNASASETSTQITI